MMTRASADQQVQRSTQPFLPLTLLLAAWKATIAIADWHHERIQLGTSKAALLSAFSI
jgi:hypothetical protein